MRRVLLFILSAVCGICLLAGCSNVKNSKQAFFTVCRIDNSGVMLQLGMTNDNINLILGAGKGGNVLLDNGLRTHFEDTKTMANCVCIVDVSVTYQTMTGLSLNNKMSDVQPMYQTDPDVTFTTNDPTKIVMTKQIDGVNYAIAVRGYSDGSIKTITVYNADLYDDADTNSEYK